ncbi:hypothetical protein BD413DRAFT_681153 [Trametes elegans]|nr:hypothetical protein BD413DRAFT_681153 [Trametes elegans]
MFCVTSTITSSRHKHQKAPMKSRLIEQAARNSQVPDNRRSKLRQECALRSLDIPALKRRKDKYEATTRRADRVRSKAGDVSSISHSAENRTTSESQEGTDPDEQAQQSFQGRKVKSAHERKIPRSHSRRAEAQVLGTRPHGVSITKILLGKQKAKLARFQTAPEDMDEEDLQDGTFVAYGTPNCVPSASLTPRVTPYIPPQLLHAITGPPVNFPPGTPQKPADVLRIHQMATKKLVEYGKRGIGVSEARSQDVVMMDIELECMMSALAVDVDVEMRDASPEPLTLAEVTPEEAENGDDLTPRADGDDVATTDCGDEQAHAAAAEDFPALGDGEKQDYRTNEAKAVLVTQQECGEEQAENLAGTGDSTYQQSVLVTLLGTEPPPQLPRSGAPETTEAASSSPHSLYVHEDKYEEDGTAYQPFSSGVPWEKSLLLQPEPVESVKPYRINTSEIMRRNLLLRTSLERIGRSYDSCGRKTPGQNYKRRNPPKSHYEYVVSNGDEDYMLLYSGVFLGHSAVATIVPVDGKGRASWGPTRMEQ